jgi:hypothetical protein
MGMSSLQVNTLETNTPAGVLAVRDSNNALTAIQLGAVRGTAANTAPVFQDSAGTQIGTLCRAWVSVDTTIATPSILGAFNVSSITDNGVGDITVNFTNPMPDTGYSSVATGLTLSNASWAYAYLTKTTSASRFRFVTISGGVVTLLDSTSFCVAVFT